MSDNRIIRVLLNILQLFMQMVVAVVVVNMLLHGFMRYEKFQVFNTLYIGVVICIFYFTNMLVKSGKLAFFLHFAAVASILFVVNGTAEDKMVIIVPAIALAYYSIKRKSEAPFMALDMGIIVFCAIVGGSIPAESGTVIPLFGAIIYVISYFIWYNLKNLNEFVIKNGSVKSFNAEQAINVNSVMLAIFMMISCVAMFVITKLNLQELIRGVLLGLWRGVLAIWHALDLEMPKGGYDLEQSLEKKPSESVEDLPGLFEMSEGNDVLDMIAVVFGSVILVCMLVMVIRSLRNFRYEKCKNSDVKEFVKPRFNQVKKAENREKMNFFWNTPNEVAVRKLYQDLIKKKLKKGQSVDDKDTPSEITTGIIGWDENTQNLTQIYEKARYSDEKISGEEVTEMRNLRKQFK